MTLQLLVAGSTEEAADALRALRSERGWPVCGAMDVAGGLATVCLLGRHEDGPPAWEKP